ncbi:MAG: hypothetical protein GY730_00055 [bacterium]|nr:hypothetical protein [bacterium]
MIEHAMLTTIISSGVLVAIVTSCCSIIISIRNEKFKKNSSINEFRYKKLFDLNYELHSLPPIDYTLGKEKNGKFEQTKDKVSNVVKKDTEKFFKIKDIFNKSTPLLDKPLIDELLPLIKQEEDLSHVLVKRIYTTDLDPPGSLKELFEARNIFKETFSASIITQLRKLVLE